MNKGSKYTTLHESAIHIHCTVNQAYYRDFKVEITLVKDRDQAHLQRYSPVPRISYSKRSASFLTSDFAFKYSRYSVHTNKPVKCSRYRSGCGPEGG